MSRGQLTVWRVRRGDLARRWEAQLEESLRSRQCDKAGFAGPGRCPPAERQDPLAVLIRGRHKVALVIGFGHMVP